jgi:hypothetical protein
VRRFVRISSGSSSHIQPLGLTSHVNVILVPRGVGSSRYSKLR